MPRKTTLSFSSEDAPELTQDAVYVYYCKYSGRHALTTDCNLNTAPRRRTDHSFVIDTNKYTVKLYTDADAVKFIKRNSGQVEKQYRILLGKLPIGYRTSPEGTFLYLFDNALTTHSVQTQQDGVEKGRTGKPPVPPCIVPAGPEGGAKILLDIEDKGPRCAVLKISADYVRVQIKHAVQSSRAIEELLDFLRGLLGVKLSQMQVERGETPSKKLLFIDGVTPEDVFDTLHEAENKTRNKSSKSMAFQASQPRRR